MARKNTDNISTQWSEWGQACRQICPLKSWRHQIEIHNPAGIRCIEESQPKPATPYVTSSTIQISLHIPPILTFFTGKIQNATTNTARRLWMRSKGLREPYHTQRWEIKVHLAEMHNCMTGREGVICHQPLGRWEPYFYYYFWMLKRVAVLHPWRCNVILNHEGYVHCFGSFVLWWLMRYCMCILLNSWVHFLACH